MADHEVKITPHIDLTEMRDWQRHLTQVEQQMARIAASAAKIKVDTGGAGGGSGGGSGGSGAGATPSQRGTRPARPSPAEAQAEQVLPHTTRKGRQRAAGSGENANTPGGLLDWMLSVFLPDQPTIQEMTGPLSGVGTHRAATGRTRPQRPTFAYNPGAWKQAPQTPEEYQDVASQILSQPGLSPAQQKATLDAALGGYTPVTPEAMAQQTDALYRARGGSSGGSGGGTRGLHPGLKSMLEAGGLGVLADLTPWALGAAGVGFVGSQVRRFNPQ